MEKRFGYGDRVCIPNAYNLPSVGGWAGGKGGFVGEVGTVQKSDYTGFTTTVWITVQLDGDGMVVDFPEYALRHAENESRV